MNVVFTEPIPTYALPFLIDGDDSGISAEDRRAALDFMAQFYGEAEKCGGHVTITPVTEDSGDFEPYFSWSPAFGLASDVVDCNITIVK